MKRERECVCVQGCVETRNAPTENEGEGDDSGEPETEVLTRLASTTEACVDAGMSLVSVWCGQVGVVTGCKRRVEGFSSTRPKGRQQAR
jgi:hypothetical protein